MRIFGRSPIDEKPQYVPGEDSQPVKVGNAQEGVLDAMRAAKARRGQDVTTLADRARKMDSMNIAGACDFLDKLSQHDRDKYLTAEKESRNRKTILGRYGRA